MIPAVLDTHLRVPNDALPVEVVEEVKVALTFPNRERDRARREKMWGWKDMPTEIKLWRYEGDDLILPRGFRWAFEETLRQEYDTFVDWDDRRTGDRVLRLTDSFPLWDHQEPAIEAILTEQDGIYKAPGGSGKTVAVLEVIRRAGMARNIVIVNSIEIADQWRERARQYVPQIECGVIGDNEWDERRLTIALQQTLYSRRDELDQAGWFSKWGLSCLDECHHQTALTFREVMSRFSGKFRFGVSYTPDKTGDFEQALAVLGDIVHETRRDDLVEKGILVRPNIRIVSTDFDFPFHSTFSVSSVVPCGIEGCPKTGKRHTHRNNYTSLLKALRQDEARNHLIASKILLESGHRQLVPSPQKGHLIAIEKAVRDLDFTDPVYSLTGDASRKERQRVIEAITSEPGLVLATIADEALDVPVLDRLHLSWPTRNLGLTRQRIARIERAAEGKGDAIGYDYADRDQPVLAKQAAERRYGCYEIEGYDLSRNPKR